MTALAKTSSKPSPVNPTETLNRANAAERAIDRADKIAGNVTPAQLTQAQQELQEDESLPPVTRPERFLAEVFGWVDPAVQFMGPASGATTVLVALGVSGPVSVVLGATLGLLWFYRPRRRRN